MFSWFVNFFLSLLNLKFKMSPTSLTRASRTDKKPFSEVALQPERIPKRPYFPLPLSILVGTNLIMLLLLLLLFCNPRLIPKKIHPPFDFRENSSSFDFRENPSKNPKENQKNWFSFAPCVFWICFKGLFAAVPLDLNFTNPKSTIFELDWKTQPLPANHDQITKIASYVFFKINQT